MRNALSLFQPRDYLLSDACLLFLRWKLFSPLRTMAKIWPQSTTCWRNTSCWRQISPHMRYAVLEQDKCINRMHSRSFLPPRNSILPDQVFPIKCLIRVSYSFWVWINFCIGPALQGTSNDLLHICNHEHLQQSSSSKTLLPIPCRHVFKAQRNIPFL